MSLATKATLFLAFIFTLQLSSLAAQEAPPPAEIEIIETRMAEVESRISEMAVEEAQLSREMESRAAAIQNLKGTGQLSFLERQRLERLLQESQDLAREISQIEVRIRDASESKTRLATKLLQKYDDEIERHMTTLSNKHLVEAVRDSSYRSIERLRQSRDLLQQEVARQVAGQLPIPRLRIEQSDTPSKIRQKADLLRDQEDKQRRFSEHLAKRIDDLQKEVNLRNRIDEFVTDLALFDQQEEALGEVESRESASLARDSGLEDFAGASARLPQETLVLTGQQEFSFKNLSDDDLEEVVTRLKWQQKLAKARADSLARQADRFNKAADDFKTNQGKR